MGNSSIRFRGKWLSVGDYTLESWLYFLACEVDELSEKPDWLLEAQAYWNIEARIQINIGTVDANLDKFVVDDERLQMMLQLAQATMIRLKTYGEEVGAPNIKNLGDFGYTDYELIDPVSHFHDANPARLCQFGTLFCELLRGTLHPAKESIMRNGGTLRVAYLIDYLETLTSDGEINSGSVYLDKQGEKYIHLYMALYWYSESNPAIKLVRNPDIHNRIRGIPDLVIDYYPYTDWNKEKIEFDLHEQYGLPEHWYIDDEEHTVTVRRLVEGKLVVVETLHAGEQFVSKILGEKVVAVDRLLRTE